MRTRLGTISPTKLRRPQTETAEAAQVELPSAEDGEEQEIEPLYDVGAFTRNMVIGAILELLVSLIALLAFIITEDMRLPMIIVDRWTPLMIVLYFLCWLIDMILLRYRKKLPEAEEEETPETPEP